MLDGKAIDHVVVLMLENRSFDHMLGHLGLAGVDPVPATAQRWSVGSRSGEVRPGPGSTSTVPVDLGHSHTSTLRQLGGGAAQDYALRLGAAADDSTVAVPLRGMPAEHVPNLAMLARRFAVCTRWFSSVPGETWPNRGFLHAGTSEGEVDNRFGVYRSRTVFQDLEEHLRGSRRPWRIYVDGIAHAMAFEHLWGPGRWSSIRRFASDVRRDRLPTYAFIEPCHDRSVARLLGRRTSSQHPGNAVARPWTGSGVSGDVWRADQLVGHVYGALRSSPDVFARTVLVVTWDEHGGFADHVPPTTCSPPGRSLESLVTGIPGPWPGPAEPFAFDTTGVRVPAVVVTPHLGSAEVWDDPMDHTAVAATIRDLFMPDSHPLSDREAWTCSLAPRLAALAGTEASFGTPAPVQGPPPASLGEVAELEDESVDVGPGDVDAYTAGLRALAEHLGGTSLSLTDQVEAALARVTGGEGLR